MATYRERGVLRRFRAAGFSLTGVLGSQVAVIAVLVALGAVGIAITARVVYGAMLPETLGLSILAFLAGLACFCAIGVALGAVLPTARAAQGAGITLFFVMMMVGGAGPPREVLTEGMQWLGEPLPFTHVVLTIQDPWLGHGWDWSSFLVVMLFTAVAAAVSVRYFRWQ